MEGSNFVDYVKIFCRSGAGGNGSVHFRQDKFTAKGGPDGGNGGKGASIILRGNKQLWTLLHLKYKRHVFAPDAEHGLGDLCTGASGQNVIVEVPLGTVARDFETGKVEFEITEDGEEKTIITGGRGGKGNAFFKSPTKQTPRFAQKGEPRKEAWKILELKVLADVGLVGFPNAGKSTLLSKLSAAKPVIADYPFTTLTPQLGIVSYREHKSFIMADIPGIIEGASEGKGLGLRFLRHIERNSVLLFTIPVDANDIKAELKILKTELKRYNKELLTKRAILAITKCDIVDDELKKMIKKTLPRKMPAVFISAATGDGLQNLKDLLWTELNAE
jgi:GTP-binding protein